MNKPGLQVGDKFNKALTFTNFKCPKLIQLNQCSNLHWMQTTQLKRPDCKITINIFGL